jgi:Raf kinase inhibitor-like YbhB/YbcL family protein
MRAVLLGGAAVIGCAVLSACGSTVTTIVPAKTLTVSSTEVDASFPRDFTCDGGDKIPNLHWNLQSTAKEIAIEMTDADAPGGTFTHWVAYGIPSNSIGFQRGLPPGGIDGKNSFGTTGYRGPCPPPGAAHHYHIRVFALDTSLNAPPGIDRAGLDARMNGHILASGELVATYQRG